WHDAFDARRCLLRCKPGRRRSNAHRPLRERSDGAGGAAAALCGGHAASGTDLGADWRMKQAEPEAERPEHAWPRGNHCRRPKFPSLERRNRAMAASTNQGTDETPVIRTTPQAREGVT